MGHDELDHKSIFGFLKPTSHSSFSFLSSPHCSCRSSRPKGEPPPPRGAGPVISCCLLLKPARDPPPMSGLASSRHHRRLPKSAAGASPSRSSADGVFSQSARCRFGRPRTQPSHAVSFTFPCSSGFRV